jgi:hypothetical protein
MAFLCKICTFYEANTCVALPNAGAHFPSVTTTIMDQKVQLLKPLKFAALMFRSIDHSSWSLSRGAYCCYLTYDQRWICIVDELKPPSLQISSCSSLHQPIGALNTGGKPSLIIWRIVGWKRESLSFYCPLPAIYIYRLWRYERCFLCPCRNMYTVNTWALYVPYDLYMNMTQSADLIKCMVHNFLLQKCSIFTAKPGTNLQHWSLFEEFDISTPHHSVKKRGRSSKYKTCSTSVAWNFMVF